MAEPRIRVPRKARKGEVIEIKTLIAHPMETGHRRDVQGRLIPRQIIHTFTCTYNGAEVFRADWHPAVAANPYLTFYTVATESGRLRFEWVDDYGTVYATPYTPSSHTSHYAFHTERHGAEHASHHTDPYTSYHAERHVDPRAFPPKGDARRCAGVASDEVTEDGQNHCPGKHFQ